VGRAPRCRHDHSSECGAADWDVHRCQVFAIPPTIYLPAELLPAVASTDKLKPFWPADMDRITTLILKHATAVDDTAVAGTVYHLPVLEAINLKGCSLAGNKTVATMIKRCPGLTKINLKGTAVNETGVRDLLDTYGEKLKVFKIDQTIIDVSHRSGTFPGAET